MTIANLDSVLEESALIDLCLGTDDDGMDIYVYTKIPLKNYASYKEAALSGNAFDPESFGEIIAQGHGRPDAALIAELKARYGFQDGFEDAISNIGHAVLEAQAKGGMS